MSQILFGAGNMYVTQLLDAFGNAPAVPQPLPLLVMQEASIDDNSSIKKLFGQNARPFAIARGETTTTLKVKNARVLANVWNAIYFGQTMNTGLLTALTDVTGTPIPTTPFTITVVPPNSGIYVDDLGVINGTTGNPMKRVASAPAAGQYSVTIATGVYLFSSADNVSGITAYINYQYSVSAVTAGYRMTVRNLAMGAAPTFRARLTVLYAGKNMHVDCRSCVATKFTLPFKNTDFAVPELDFELQDDGVGNVFDISTAE
jgi:hypothetical protein